MAALLLLIVVAAVAGGIWFFLQQRKCATLVCSKKNDPAPTAPSDPTPAPLTSNEGVVRQRPSKPTKLDQRDLFAEFMEKEGANPSPAATPRKGSSDRVKTEQSAPSATPEAVPTPAPTEAPTQMCELSPATPAITPLPTAGNTSTKDVQTDALIPTPTGTTPPSVKRPSRVTQGGVDEPTTNETASKKKTKKKKTRGSRMSANKTATASSKSKKSKKSKKGKKKSAGK